MGGKCSAIIIATKIRPSIERVLVHVYSTAGPTGSLFCRGEEHRKSRQERSSNLQENRSEWNGNDNACEGCCV